MKRRGMRGRSALPIVLAAAVLSILAARLIARFALDDVPHVMDEIAYVLQARTFALGKLVVDTHLPRAAFAMWFVDDRTSMFSIFPPGWPAVLAPFELVHAREWANPLLHGATVLVVSAIARRLAGGRAAALAGVAYAFSPQALLLAASLMSHALVALLATVVAYAGVGLAIGRARARDAGFAGAALGMLALTRPLCAVVVAAGLAALAIAALIRKRRPPLAWCAALVAPAILGVAILAAYNRELTGSATRFPQSAYFDEHVAPLDDPQFAYRRGCNDLGLGPGHGCDYGIPNATHDLKNALSNTGDNLRAWTLLACGGPLAFVALAIALLRARRRAATIALATFPAAAIALYALYWYSGTCFGARFYHAALPPLIVAAAIGVDRLAKRAPRAAIAACAVALGWNAIAMVASTREIAAHYWGTDDRFARAAASWRGDDALAMVAFRDERLPERRTYVWTSFLRESIWRNSVRALSALAVNSPELDGRVVFAKYHPALVADLRARFPGRRLFLYVVDDAAGDRVEPYDDSPLAAFGRNLPPPRENFDAFVIPR
jgi:hypothetical protein